MHKVNLNSRVEVTLKAKGASILNNQMRAIPGHEGYSEHKAGDIYRSQLWCIMNDFGPHILMGGELPIETSLSIEDVLFSNTKPAKRCDCRPN